jgi:hypothetical protein
MPQLRKICISAVAAIAMVASSMPIAESSPADTQANTQYIARSFGTFRSRAACRARGRRLVRRGVIRGFRCLSPGSRVRRKRVSRNRITRRRTVNLGTFRSQRSGRAACRAALRRLSRRGAGSYRCTYRYFR